MATPSPFLPSNTVQVPLWRRIMETASALGLLLVFAKLMSFLTAAGWAALKARDVHGLVDLLVNLFLLALQAAFCLLTFGLDLVALGLALYLVFNVCKPRTSYNPPFAIIGNAATVILGTMARFL